MEKKESGCCEFVKGKVKVEGNSNSIQPRIFSHRNKNGNGRSRNSKKEVVVLHSLFPASIRDKARKCLNGQ